MKKLREQLQMYGVESLSASELIAFVLSRVPTRKDTIPIALKLLEKYGERNLRNVSEAELVSEGLTRGMSQLLKVVCDAVRLSAPPPQERPQIASADMPL